MTTNLMIGGSGELRNWDGTSMSNLISEGNVDGWVYALEKVGGDTYIGGAFTTVAGISSPMIARWDGTAWSSMRTSPYLPTGVSPGSIRKIVFLGSSLYVFGTFTQIGGVTAKGVARWDGSAWQAIGDGTISASGGVNATSVYVDGTDIYVGGSFTALGGTSANRIIRLDTTNNSLHALGTGLAGTVTGTVQVTKIVPTGTSGHIYVAGNFATAGGSTAKYVARWDGSAWYPIGTGAGTSSSSGTPITHIVYDSVNSKLYIAGTFTAIGGTTTTNMAMYTGSGNPSAMSSALTGPRINSIEVDTATETIYAAGSFTSIGGVTANSIAKWTSGSWSAVTRPLGEGVYAFGHLFFYNSKLYATYVFPYSSKQCASIYDPSLDTWTDGSVYNGYSGPYYSTSVQAFTAIEGVVYVVGGTYTTSVTQPGYVGVCSGTPSLLPQITIPGLHPSQKVSCAAQLGTDWYFGGNFITVMGVYSIGIIRWDGTQFHAVLGYNGQGLNNPVTQLATAGSSTLYVLGSFTQAGTVSVAGIAKWEGSDWSYVGASSLDITVSPNTLVTDSAGNLYVDQGVDGFFNGGVKWDGTGWTQLTGIDNLTCSSWDKMYNCAGTIYYLSSTYGLGHMYQLLGTAWNRVEDATSADEHGNIITGALVAGSGVGELYAARFGALCSNTGTPVVDVHTITFSDLAGTNDGDFVLVYSTRGPKYGIALNGNSWPTPPSGIVWNNMNNAVVVHLAGCTTKEDIAEAVVVRVATFPIPWSDFTLTDNGDGSVTCTQSRAGELYDSTGTGNRPSQFLTYTGTGVPGGSITVNHTVTGATTWVPRATPAGGTSPKINTLAVVGTDIYVGGSFTALEGVAAVNLAKWDGSSVSAVSNGVPRPVYALANAFSSNVRVLLQNDHTYDYQLQIPADPETGTASYSIVIPAKGEVILDLADWLRVEWEDSKTIAQKNNLSIKKVLRHPSILG